MRRRSRSCARCGHARSMHYRSWTGRRSLACTEGWAPSPSVGWHVASDAEECRCEGFVQATPDRKKRGSRRSVRTYAIAAQLAWARAACFANREGHGADSIYFGPDGEALLCGEHKHRPAPTYWETDMKQAKSYALTQKGRPFPVVGYTSKPGAGREARRYMVIDAADWPAIVDRLKEEEDEHGSKA